MEEAAQDFARQHPNVILYMNPHSGPSPAPVLRAEYCECWGPWGGDGDGGLAACPGSVLPLPGADGAGAAAVGWGSAAAPRRLQSGGIPALPPRSAAVNGTVRDELIASKTSEEIVQLATKLANQSGLDIIRIRKPFHTDNPSVQGQWHPLTNKPSILTVQGPRLQPQ